MLQCDQWDKNRASDLAVSKAIATLNILGIGNLEGSTNIEIREPFGEFPEDSGFILQDDNKN